jgi:hypothetical protein
LLSQGFAEAKADTSLFIFCRRPDTTYLLYIDDIILMASFHDFMRRIISFL